MINTAACIRSPPVRLVIRHQYIDQRGVAIHIIIQTSTLVGSLIGGDGNMGQYRAGSHVIVDTTPVK
ncbi:hypothetical protein FQZ97_941360 [compost metagenome]